MSHGEKTKTVASILFMAFVKAPLWILGQLGSRSDSDPEPVCDCDTVGVEWKGRKCMKMSDGTYQWRKVKGQ